MKEMQRICKSIVKYFLKKPRQSNSGVIKNLFSGLKAVFQRDGAVKDQMTGLGVLTIGTEVAGSHKLEAVGRLCVAQCGFNLTAGQNLQGVGIQTS